MKFQNRSIHGSKVNRCTHRQTSRKQYALGITHCCDIHYACTLYFNYNRAVGHLLYNLVKIKPDQYFFYFIVWLRVADLIGQVMV